MIMFPQGEWEVASWTAYVAMVLLAGVGVRLLLSAIRALRDADNASAWKYYNRFFLTRFIGFRSIALEQREWIHPDYCISFILGLLEICIYAPLMAANAWGAVGAWIALKTVSQWTVWAKERAVFNLFLIGTLLNGIAAFVLVRPLISFNPV